MSKRKDKIISTVLGVTIIAVCCTVGIGFRNNKIAGSNGNSVRSYNRTFIIDRIGELNGKSKEDVYEELGEPKEIYQEKVYTYIDSIGKYDLLIKDKVENIVVTLNESSLINDDIMLDYLDVKVKDSESETVTMEGKDIITIYEKGNYKKISMACRQNSEILEKVKIDMK